MALREFLANSKDDQSIYHQLKNAGQHLSENEILHDVTGLLEGGLDSTAHTMTAMLYLAKRHPEHFAKLSAHIDQHVQLREEKPFLPQFKDAVSRDKLGQMDYLSNFVKEAQRFDGAAITSLTYDVKEDCTIRGV